MPDFDPTERRSLTQLRLRNFKSVLLQTVDLKPLTVVIGANSSGKSSLLQALLTMAQAVQIETQRAAIPLNGHLTNLGYFDQAKHFQAPAGEPVMLGLTATIHPTQHFGFFTGMRSHWQSVEELVDREWTVDFDVEFKSSDPDDPISSPLQRIRLSAKPARSAPVELDVRRGPRTKVPIRMADVVTAPMYRTPAIDLHDRLRGTLTFADRSSRVAAVGLNGLLPTTLVTKTAERTALARYFVDFFVEYLLGPMSFSSPSGAPEEERETLERSVELGLRILRGWLDQGRTEQTLATYVRQSLSADTPSFSSGEVIYEHRDLIMKRIARGLPAREQVPVFLNELPAALTQIACSNLSRMLNDVKHLGGLRAAPQPLYPTSPQAQRGDLGRNGEYSAAVMYSLRRRVVSSFDENGQLERVSLQRAVQSWATRLQLFNDVESHHQGALGIDIQVTQPGLDRSVDITAVGLGVSQLLPVLLRCLLSGPDEIVLLEQPELHLHPASQQRLADFLLACVLSGRQIIVETHSEHLVNRLRLKAAQDETDSVAKLVGLVFAERDQTAGETHYRNVGLNPYGGLTEWPSEFMTEGISDAQSILQAGLAKLAALPSSHRA